MSKIELPVTITPSRTELASRCHRRHFLADILGRARYASPSLEFGSVVHAGIAAHWLGQDVRSALSTEWSKRKVESDSLTLKLAESMMDHYVQNAQIAGPLTSQGNFKLVDVEQRFEVKMIDAKLSFQCDRIAHDPDQNWMVISDSKTAGRLDARWERQWETSLQMKLYRAGAMQVFQSGGRVDILVEGVLKHVPSDIRYYLCPEWSTDFLLEAASMAYGIAKADEEILLDRDATNNSENDGITVSMLRTKDQIELDAVTKTAVNYMDCRSYGIECPYLRLCTAEPDQRVALLHAEYFETTEESY